MAQENLACPECRKRRLVKDGRKWSGRHKVQRFRCLECGRTTTAPVQVAKLGRPKKVTK